MSYSVAYKSVRKYYIGGMMMLIATAITTLGLVFTLLVASVVNEDLLGEPLDYGDTYAAFVTNATDIAITGSVMMHLGLVLLIVAYIINVIGLASTVKESRLFKQGLVCGIAMLAISIAAAFLLFFAGNYIITVVTLLLSTIVNMFIMLIVTNGIRKISTGLSFKKSIGLIKVIVIIALFLNLMEFIIPVYAFVFAAISGLALIVSCICYLNVLKKARKKLNLS